MRSTGSSRFHPGVEMLEDRLAPATFVVTRSADDSNTGSLRWAITQANNSPGADTITFNIAGSGVHTIQPQSALPTITDPVLLDGTSQPGYSGTPLIELDGTQAGNVDGLDVSAGNCTIKGLAINRFSKDGIVLFSAAGNSVISGNYLGTDPTGASAEGNGVVDLVVLTANNTIGGITPGAGNVLSGGGQVGLQFYGSAATGNVVLGNFIGTDPTGTAAVANGLVGILINGQASGNTIGGTSAAAANVLSGNKQIGVEVSDAGTENNVVEGNIIGSNATGTAALANGIDGVLVHNGATNNTIGGAAMSDRNLISGNTQAGVQVDGSGTTGNVVEDNDLGTTTTGSAALPNGVDLHVSGGATNNTIVGNVQFASPGSWTEVTDPLLRLGALYLLSDGAIMVADGNYWGQLTPDASGSYLDGQWSDLPSTSIARSALGSVILRNGDLMIYGGENTSLGPATDLNSGDLYDPTTNTWTTPASIPTSLDPTNTFGDAPLELLPDGRVLGGYINGPQTFVYDPTSNSWSAGPTKLDPGVSGISENTEEETWVKLPGPAGNILDYEIFASINQPSGYAEYLDTTTNQWLATGPVPVPLTSGHEEMGPAILLPDGQVFQVGANGTGGGSSSNTALYDSSTNTWTAGPVIPNGNIADDDPAAILPDGNVLFGANSSPPWVPPVTIFEYDPSANTITPLTLPSVLGNELATTSGGAMLVLPTGQIGFVDVSGDLWLYSEPGTVNPAWAPTISTITSDGGNTYTLTGTQLNGLNEGASYGDDLQMAENYPLVQITNAAGTVSYARTFNWSSTAVATGNLPETTQFTLPAGLGSGSNTLRVIADGISSAPLTTSFVTTNPVSETVNAGQTATFTAASSSSSEPVQWQVSSDGITFTDIAGANRDTCSFTATAAENHDEYRAVFSGTLVSSPATLTVDYVTANPANQTVAAGQGVTFTAASSDPSGSDTVQWYVSADAGGSFSAISGATSTTYSFTASAAQNGNEYEAVFANSSPGTLTSRAAILSVPVADHLGFAVQPSSTAVGARISPAVQVQVFDQFGNVLTSDSSDQVTLALGSKPAGGTLSGTTTVTVSGGVATFADLSIDAAGNGYTLDASASGLPAIASTPFDVTVSPPDHLAFLVQPDSMTAGSPLDPAVQVEVLDPAGHLISSDNNDQVTLSMASGPGGFSAASTLTVTVSGGIATFSNLVLTAAGSYSLKEQASGGLGGPDSSSFTISPAAAEQLAFGVLPGSAVAGQALAPPVMARILDAYGNLVSGDDSDQVTLSIASGPGTFTPGSELTATASGGVATFSNLVLDTAGSYTLAASSGTFSATSGSLVVGPAAADHLAFLVQPVDSVAGTPFPVKVQLLDTFGNLLTGDNSDRVTLSVAGGPGALGGTTTVTVQGGVASFANLVLTAAGHYTLIAQAGSLSSPPSAGFSVAAAAADHLAFSVQPGSGTAGTAINPAVQVQVQDRYDNLLTADSSDQVTLGVASGPGGFAPGSTTTATLSNGLASFGNLVLDTAGTYTLDASTGGLASASSSAFGVNPLAPDHLVFAVQPGDSVAGAALGVVVQVLDRFGNLQTADSSDQVTLSVASGPGNVTATAPVSNGVAAFANLVLTAAGSYTLGVTGTGDLGGADSNGFTIGPAAADHLAFRVPPADAIAGQPLTPAVQAAVFDRFGNPVPSDNTDRVTISIATGPGALSPMTATVSGGVATFPTLVLTSAGTCTLSAAAAGLSGAVSPAFHVSAAAADHLAFLVQPGRVAAGQVLSPPPQVAIEDAFGNVVGGDSSTVSVALAGNPAGVGLGGTLGVPAISGIATFSDLTLSAGGSFMLQASDGSLAGTTSSAFEVDQLLLSSASVREFRPTGTGVGTLGVLGGSGHTFHYTLVGSAPFTISGNRLLSADAFDFTARPSYSVRVRARDETGRTVEQTFAITVLADPHLTRKGRTLTVTGTARNDTFTFTPGSVRDSLSLNGTRLAADAASVRAVVFQGGGGSDTATLTGSAGSDTFSGRKGSSTLSGKGYSVTVLGVRLVKVNGSGGSDTGVLSASPGNNRFTGFKDTGTLDGVGYRIVIASLEDVTLNGKVRGSNTIHLAWLAYKLHLLGVWIPS